MAKARRDVAADDRHHLAIDPTLLPMKPTIYVPNSALERTSGPPPGKLALTFSAWAEAAHLETLGGRSAIL